MSAPVARTPRTPGGSVQGTRQQLDELDALLQRMLTLPVSPGDGFPAATTPSVQPPFPEEEWVPPAAQATYPPPPPPRPTPPPSPSQQRGYPASYMVIETATPPFFDPNDAGLGPRKISAEPRQQASPYSYPTPVPGGRHQLVEDTPHDPIAEAARAQLSMPDEGEWVPLQSTWQPSAQTWKPLAETWEQSRGSAPPRPTMPEPPMMSSWRESVIPPPPPGYEELQRAATPPQPTAPASPEPPPPQVAAPPERTPLLLAPVVWFNKGFDLMLAPLGPVGRWFRGPTGRTVLGTVGLLCLAGAIGFGVLERFGWTR
jgi:hypothetical protein